MKDRCYALVMYGDKVQRTILSIDVGNEFADHTLKFGRIGQGRACDLNHDDVAHPLRVVLQELLECTELRKQLDSSCRFVA